MRKIGLLVLIVALAGFAVAFSQGESVGDANANANANAAVVSVPVSVTSAKSVVIEEAFYTVGRLQRPHGDVSSGVISVTVASEGTDEETNAETDEDALVVFKIETQLTADQVRLLENAPQTVIQVRTSSADHGLLNATIDASDSPRKLKNGLSPIILTLQPTGRTLLDGEYAEVIFRTDVRVVKAVPLKAVKRLGQETFLFTVEDGLAVRVPVQLGRSSGDWVEVKDDGKGNDESAYALMTTKWVLRGIESLQDATPVVVVE